MATRNPLAALPSGVRQLVYQRLSSNPHSRPSIPLRLQPSVAARTAARRSHGTSTSQSYTSSVNETEVSHFNALASSWWDPHGSSRLLHLMNPLRHTFISHCKASETITTSPPNNHGQTYLDIGCGAGIFTESAARLPSTATVTGLDPTPEVIAVARQHARQDPILQPRSGKLRYRNHALEDLPADFPQVDVVSLFEVIEHIRHPAPFLEQCLQRVKPGGWLVGSTIARTASSWFTTKFMAEEVLRLVPRGTHEWGQYIMPEEMREWAVKQRGVEEGSWKCQGVVYVPGVGWREVNGSEAWGNYFFGMRKKAV